MIKYVSMYRDLGGGGFHLSGNLCDACGADRASPPGWSCAIDSRKQEDLAESKVGKLFID